MTLRKLFLVLFAILALSVATLSAAMAAPSAQEAPSDSDAVAQHRQNKLSHAFLGLLTQKLRDRDRAVLGVPDGVAGSLLVVGALPGSPAEEAGLRRTDVALTFNGLALATPRELDRLIRGMSPGDVMEITYWRESATRTVGVFLADRTDHEQPKLPAWLVQLHRFMRSFPNTVDGTLRVIGADEAIHEYVVTPGTISVADGNRITVENRLGEPMDLDLVDGSVVVKGQHRIAASELTVGTEVVVLQIDGTLKAVVIVRQRLDVDAALVRPDEIDRIEPNPRRQIVQELIERLSQENGQGDDSGSGEGTAA